MSNDAYSPFKAVRHLDVIQGVREGKSVRPAHVQLIISDLCNQSCNFCSYRAPGYSSSEMFYEIVTPDKKSALRRDPDHQERNYNPNRMIPFGKILEILDDCKAMGVSGVQITGGGEPTVHPKFLETLEACRERGLAYSVVTNGVNIAKKWTPELAQAIAHAAWMRISLDAGQRGTYAKIRNVPGDHFDAACQAISLLAETRRANASMISPNGPRTPSATLVIGVGFVVTPANWFEVGDAVALAKSLGADNIRISAQFSNDDEQLFASFHDRCADLCAATVHKYHGKDGFQVYNRFGQKLDELRLKHPEKAFCGYQSITTYIGATLDVYRCCVTSYSQQGLVGSLKEQRFKDLWLSQARADDMACFDATKCPRCQFTKINEFLDYAMRADTPPHSEFV